MGRPTHSRALSVWANGEPVGRWIQPARGDMSFVYDPAWRSSPAGRPLSLSLPYTADTALKGERVRCYFDNLLPDSEPIRRRLALRFRTGSTQAFDLLQAIGRDCVGAVQLLGDDDVPGDVRRVSATPLSETEVERVLRQAVATESSLTGWDDGHEDLRISLAGAQEKTALLWHQGQWMRPHGSTPTTHILKLPMGLVGQRQADFSTSVHNEWLCMNLLAAYGLPVATTALLKFGGQTVLGVERFDRQWHSSGRWLMRLPQEDFCQVKGLPAQLKYQSDGGPGWADLADVVRGSVNAEQDLGTLLKTQLLFWLLGAPDGHAKNFSLRLWPQGRFSLTPLYDVMSIWPVVGAGPRQVPLQKVKLAMAMGGPNPHYRHHAIQRRHFNRTAARYFGQPDAEGVIAAVLARTPGAIDTVAARLPAGFPQGVANAIFEGLRRAAAALARMPAA
ncbi:MAG: type II toxin-antitoxin system HipA family toxin [Pseudomonadota bacterium]